MVPDRQVLVLGQFSHLLSLDRTVTNDEGQALGPDMLILNLNISIHGTFQWAFMYG